MSRFLELERSARACFRMSVLMGANTRTYKFALAESLLHFGALGREAVPLDVFVEPYTMEMARRQVAGACHVSATAEPGPADFLTHLERDAAASLALGHPTDALREAAVASVPGMVMKKFPMVGGAPLPIPLYRMDGRGKHRTVVLTPEMREVAAPEHLAGLRAETRARQSIVEASFDAGIGRDLMAAGVIADPESGMLQDVRRRRSVARVDDAVRGFQHGRCLLCRDPLAPGDDVDIDHVFPFVLMRRFGVLHGWRGPDLDALWNLAPAHRRCNIGKSADWPEPGVLDRLVERNEAITGSPHPLSKTLQLALKAYGGRWGALFDAVRAACE
ncbi:HNH endonuclease [Streptomyces xiamenensis]|uniref:HNH endonuclease n=1 Tax=Streptomyces xiamenensis TaxID=408015 RepID=UPI003D720EF1